jgi:peptidoglycan hydrolase-like protein with peptidoglycan-binding domain
MFSRKIILPTLLLSLVAGLGVSAEAAQTQAAKKKSPAGSSKTSSSKAHSSGKKGARRSRRQPGQKAPTKDRVSEIQSALAKDGSYSGEPNGKWDDSTVTAMKKYQAAHGLNPTGKLDARTLQKLGLGGTTAGVAAPVPPMGATSRLTSSASKPSSSPAPSEPQQ